MMSENGQSVEGSWGTMGLVMPDLEGRVAVLDELICERARLARDPRYDGRFFIGVLSTGIYCRPICPAPTAKRSNVRYFPSAAGAAQAGFRPCLRCRPEIAPGTPAWNGTAATVGRALRLIGQGALDDGSVEDLAERLGVSARHLHRLFLSHLGAPAVAVAQTRRLEFAKQLVSDTDLPMNQVARASGFQSIRRFNDTFRRQYRRAPSKLRRTRTSWPRAAEGQYVFRLGYRPPFDWDSHLAFLAARAILGVEEVRAGTYRRTFALQGLQGTLEVRPRPRSHAVEARISFSEPSLLLRIVTRVRAMFDLGADPATVARHFRGDPLLAPLVRKYPGLRVAGAWDGFELAVRTILGQQVTVSGASTLAGRLARRYGEPLTLRDRGGLSHVFPAADVLAEADIAGLPAARADAIRALSRAVLRGEVDLASPVLTDHITEALLSVKGIGEWTAQYVAMRAFGEPDAFPADDLVLRQMAGNGVPLSRARLRERADTWRPWRAYAAMYLWRGAAEMSTRGATRTTRRTDAPFPASQGVSRRAKPRFLEA
jgi:AraC family transcriptional regulator of adaptative response / DNA-3-methyladenine glycosylase II